MTRRTVAIDVGIAVLVLGLSLGMVAAHGLGTPDPSNRDLDGWGALLVVLAVGPLVARRAAPVLVYVSTLMGSLALLTRDYAIDVPLAPLIGVYTMAMAYGGDPRRARRWGAFAAAGAFTPAVMVGYALSGEWPRLVPEMLVLVLMVTGVWIAGDRSRLRLERIAELEERARRGKREAERERRLAAAEERTRIARELHDSAGHAINVILVQAGAARLLQERDPERSRRALATVEEVARGTIGEIDRLVHALREEDGAPPDPADPAALEELVRRYRSDGLEIATDLSGRRGALPHSVAWAAYRILQESLTNAARHGAGRADVAVSFGADAVEITVINPTAPAGGTTGRGAASAGTGNGGHGIVGMRERATLLGGTLEAAEHGGRFRLYARLPCVEDRSNVP